MFVSYIFQHHFQIHHLKNFKGTNFLLHSAFEKWVIVKQVRFRIKEYVWHQHFFTKQGVERNFENCKELETKTWHFFISLQSKVVCQSLYFTFIIRWNAPQAKITFLHFCTFKYFFSLKLRYSHLKFFSVKIYIKLNICIKYVWKL